MSRKTENTVISENIHEKGQSIVLVTFMMIGLIAFVGIAVDVGFLFARRSQLSKAVDAAALAAVTEVESETILDAANLKAGQFLGTNLPITAILSDTLPELGVLHFESAAWRDEDLGSFNYTITATWPVEQYFLKVVGRDFTRITGSATAAYFPTTDIYASRRVEDGALASSNQAVFGPFICSRFGDPYSPNAPTWPKWYLDRTPFNNDSPYNGLYTYQYRILIPPDYDLTHDVIRVELFDPDTINQANNGGDSQTGESSAQVAHTSAVIGMVTDPPDEAEAARTLPETESLSCDADWKNPCLIDTDERYTGLPEKDINPWWFVRIDENRNPGCVYTPEYTTANNTHTIFTLRYLKQNNDGTIESQTLAQYTGQAGNAGDSDGPGSHGTDMRWVSPGGAPAFDRPPAVETLWPTVDVPADPGFGIERFEINIDEDLPNILVDGETGNRYLYLDVTAFDGSSENGFEIWAGPPDYVDTVPGNVNLRNVHIINNPGSHSSDGVTVFGLNNLPMNSNVNYEVDIPLLYVPPESAGGTILVSLFDPDSGAQPPIGFYFDSVAEADWYMEFASTANPNDDPDLDYWIKQGVAQADQYLNNPLDNSGAPYGYPRCFPGGSNPSGGDLYDCQDRWVNPPYAIQIPTLDPTACSGLDPSDPEYQNVCTPFVGGRLVVRYTGGQNDTYGWMIRLKGLPFLVR